MQATVIVAPKGGSHTIASLSMKCDSKRIPELTSGAKPTGWWLAERCQFDGAATAESDGGAIGASTNTTLQGTAAVAVGEGRLIGILSPNGDGESSLWWTWPLSDIQVETASSQGFLRKRPTEITLKAADGTLRLAEVARLYRHSGSYQTGQEASFLKALGR